MILCDKFPCDAPASINVFAFAGRIEYASQDSVVAHLCEVHADEEAERWTTYRRGQAGRRAATMPLEAPTATLAASEPFSRCDAHPYAKIDADGCEACRRGAPPSPPLDAPSDLYDFDGE